MSRLSTPLRRTRPGRTTRKAGAARTCTVQRARGQSSLPGGVQLRGAEGLVGAHTQELGCPLRPEGKEDSQSTNRSRACAVKVRGQLPAWSPPAGVPMGLAGQHACCSRSSSERSKSVKCIEVLFPLSGAAALFCLAKGDSEA